jgi:exopolyphosphatase/guanosine-5'-triphosphate,3'-diphosphate pyrophosphatase
VAQKLLASIDIGTNTFRLLIAEVYRVPGNMRCSFKEICSERVITRLGEGMHDSGFLTKEAIEKSIHVLQHFSDIISRHNVYKTAAVATSALREAQNREAFLSAAKIITGIDITVISGDKEAALTASGMLIGMDVPESALMIDIGGGSTELICARQGKPLRVDSINAGVVYLAGKYMKHDPPLRRSLTDMEKEVSVLLHSIAPSYKKRLSKDSALIGTAGTVTTLSAVVQNLSSFDHAKIHNYKLHINSVQNIYSHIARISSKERAEYIPYEPERLDIIVPGTLILLRLMKTFSFREITVSNYGLREGILVNLYKSLLNEE